jgi:hypothetical protein
LWHTGILVGVTGRGVQLVPLPVPHIVTVEVVLLEHGVVAGRVGQDVIEPEVVELEFVGHEETVVVDTLVLVVGIHIGLVHS